MKINNTNLTINVKDLDKSIAFYQSIGFHLDKRWGAHYAQLSAPDLVIGLHPTDENKLVNGSGNVSIGFTTDDFEATKTDLQRLSIAAVERSEAGGKFLHFSDPDGAALYFIEPVKH